MDFVSERYSDPGLRAPGELRDTVMGWVKNKKSFLLHWDERIVVPPKFAEKSASLTRDKGREPPSSESGYRTVSHRIPASRLSLG
ncbi:MAG: hypothetical protein IKI93_06350 [Clostridia bacterium]|nr:hypothetical protein [Clostridia bacterium]